MWWESFCPTCGLTRSRWAGCDDSYHGRSERIYGDTLFENEEVDPDGVGSTR